MESEVSKLQKHLALLREEYVKIQNKYEELNRKYQIATANNQQSGTDDGFVFRLLDTVAKLFNNPQYSDLDIELGESKLRAHKFVLRSRSDAWINGGLDSVDKITLDSDISSTVGEALFRWVYTDQINIQSDSDFLLSLLRCAGKYELNPLMIRCEQALTSHVNVKNCIKFYQASHQIQAEMLMNHCSDIISNHWDDFTSEDFASMSATLLYQMFKSKSRFTLHRAIKAHREDVVFLYIIEFNSQLTTLLNERDEQGFLPLELSLKHRQTGISDTLVKNQVDINILDNNGFTLLHNAILQGDYYSAEYLILNDINVNQITYEHKLTPLHMLSKSPLNSTEKYQISNLLIKHEADINMTDVNGCTALHKALEQLITHNEQTDHTTGVIPSLLECSNLDLNIENHSGYTPLSYILLCDESSQDDIDFTVPGQLIEKGASLQLVNSETGNTLLHETIIADRETASMFLTQRSAPLNKQNKKGETALHLSCKLGMLELSLLLLEKGSNPNSQTHLTQVEKKKKFGKRRKPSHKEPTPPPQSISTNQRSGSFTSANQNRPSVVLTRGDSIVDYNPFNVGAQQSLNPFGEPNDQTSLNPFEEAEEYNPFVTGTVNHLNEDELNTNGTSTVPKPNNAVPVDIPPEASESSSSDSESSSEADDDVEVSLQTPLHKAIVNQHEQIVDAILKHKDKLLRSKDNFLPMPKFTLRDSKQQTPLAVALWAGLHKVAKQLMMSGCSVNDKNEEGLTLLHQAVLKQDTPSCIFLLSHQADIKQRTRKNESVIELSIRKHLHGVLSELCKYKTPVSSLTSAGNPLIWLALELDDIEAANILVKNDCDVNFWNEGPNLCRQTLLHRAIIENKQKHGCFLIQNGCDLNSSRKPSLTGEGGPESRDGQTPLHLSSERGLEEVVQKLMEFNADINIQDSEGRTALHVSISCQKKTVTYLLLSHPELDVTLRDQSGWSPFATAMTHADNKAARAILDRAPNAADQFDNRGRNFLHVAVQKSDIESVLFLLSVNADVNSRMRDSERLTPLHLAVKSGNEMIVRNLLLAGASIHELTENKQTSLHIAAEFDHSAIASILIENSIDFTAVDNDRNNALHVAIRYGNLSTSKILLTETSIGVECVNLKGRNCLHILSHYGKENSAAIYDQLISAYPNYPINKTDLNGNTALLLAYMNGNGQLCRALVRSGACLGASNHEFVNIFNAPVASKHLLTKLLDMLSAEPPWAEGDCCLNCSSKFNIANRKHHCRHCGRLLCSKCSSRDIPIIKFSLNKPVRVCEICFNVLTLGA